MYLELGEVDVEGAVESERSSDGGNDLKIAIFMKIPNKNRTELLNDFISIHKTS